MPLNPSQQIAVDKVEWPLLVLAWAWSWKTFTLTERVWSLIEKHNIPPEQILCVTFTNKAAKEMKERIASRIWVSLGWNNMFKNYWLPLIWTFHSLAVFFLRQYIDKIWYEKNFVIYDTQDAQSLVRSILKESNIKDKDLTPRKVQSAISYAKTAWKTCEEFAQSAQNRFQEIVAQIYPKYEKRLSQSNALDFDDLLWKLLEILKVPEVLEDLHSRYKYFLVDEYQDTNHTQYKIIKLLSKQTKNLCVVWDDWQWIYSWRGANIENILNFEKDYKDALVVKLEQNYRSTKHIISWANQVIKYNTTAREKELWTDNKEWDKIKIMKVRDEKSEAYEVAKTISKSLDEYSKHAILYRTNTQSRVLEEHLIKKNIPYKIFGWLKFYDRKEIKDLLAYIRLIVNNKDDASFLRIINVPWRKIWAKSIEYLNNYAREYWLNYFDLLDMIDEIPDIWKAAKLNFTKFRDIINGIKKEILNNNNILNKQELDRINELDNFKNKQEILALNNLENLENKEEEEKQIKINSVSDLMRAVLNKIKYKDYLIKTFSKDEAQSKLDNIDEFISMASRYDWMDLDESINLFLEEVALLSDSDNTKEWEVVSLMTIHTSKWLEYDNIYLVWLEEWIFPSWRSMDDELAIEEERRLMYVAMTRAKERLFIYHTRERYQFWNYTSNPESRFLKEIPEDNKEIQEQESKLSWSVFSSLNSPYVSNPTPASASSVSKSIKTRNKASDFNLWDRLNHPKFWIWTIVSLKWATAEIAFSWVIKKMNIEIAPVKKI